MNMKKSRIGEVVGRGIGTLVGMAMVVLSLIASPFVLWVIGGDDEGSSWSSISIIVLVIVCVIFIGGLVLMTLSNKRKNNNEENCGKSATTHIVCECGHKNQIDAQFCNKCGKKLK